jgi:hypothetical protein
MRSAVIILVCLASLPAWGGQHLVGRHGAVMSQQSIVIFPMSQWILDNVRPSIEALVFDNVQPNTPPYGCRRDDYLQLELAYFF